MSKTALIIGIDSNIGRVLAAHLRAAGWEIYGTSRRTPQNDPHIFYVDLEQEQTIKNIHGYFDAIYACAAVTNMAFCENNPEVSKQVNFTSQVALAKHCINKTASYVFLSTAGVFDGTIPKRTTNEAPSPKCMYGTHKAMAEQFLLNLSDKITIVRTTKVITRDNSLVMGWIKNLNSDLPIQPFNDMTLSGVTIDALINLLHQVGENQKSRIVHISGKDDFLYSDFAVLLANRLGKPSSLVQPISYRAIGITPTTVFPYSSLDMSETTKAYGINPCVLEDLLDLVLEVKISIVIPNYNHAQYLPMALERVLQQQTPAYEILVIDDASTDNSVAVIQDYARRYPQLKFLQNEKNMGVIATLNRGLQEAQGTHINFAAADDWLEPNFLQQATKLLQAHPNAGFISGTSWILYEDNPNKLLAARSPIPIRDDGYISPQQAQRLIGKLDSWFMGNTVVYNTSYLRAEGGFNPDLQSFTDNFMCRVLAAKYGCCFTPSKLGTWRIRTSGYATAFGADIARQAKVMRNATTLLKNNYSEIFSRRIVYKIQQRLNFNLARTLWNANDKNSLEMLEQHLKLCLPNKLLYPFVSLALLICKKIPVGKALGRLCLFVFIRPFDIWQQLRIQVSMHS